MRIGSTTGLSVLASKLGASANDRRVTPLEAPSAHVEETDRGGVPVPVAPIGAGTRAEETGRIVRHRVDAAFLAHLIAMAADLPPTRRLRRIEADRGAATYARAVRGEGLLVPGYFVDVAR